MQTVTVRMPSDLHGRLKDEARHKQTSMNKLCVSALHRLVSSPADERPEPAAATAPAAEPQDSGTVQEGIQAAAGVSYSRVPNVYSRRPRARLG